MSDKQKPSQAPQSQPTKQVPATDYRNDSSAVKYQPKSPRPPKK